MSWQRAVLHRQRAAALEARGRSEEAVHAYRETLRCDPESADAHLRLGLLLRELGRDEEANQVFEAALRLRSASQSALPRQQVITWTEEAAAAPASGAGSDNIEE